MVNKALVLENNKGVMGASVSWCVSISWAVAPDRMLLPLQLDLCSTLFNRSFSRDLSQLDKDFLPRNVKLFNASTISIPLLLEIKMFRGPKLLKTHCRLNRSAMPVERKVILLTDVLIHARALIVMP
jgi:hypothetical protein